MSCIFIFTKMVNVSIVDVFSFHTHYVTLLFLDMFQTSMLWLLQCNDRHILKLSYGLYNFWLFPML